MRNGAVQLLNVVPADQPALRVAHQIDLLAPVVTSELLDMLGQYASEKHYGDACVDAEQLDEMIGELERRPGTFPEPSRMRATTRCRRRSRNPLCSTGFQRERATGVEPATSSLGIRLTKSRKTMIRGRIAESARA